MSESTRGKEPEGKVGRSLPYSDARYRLLMECPRQYYYKYYLSMGGHRETSSDERQMAYLAKCYYTTPVLAGLIVHEVLDDVLFSSEACDWVWSGSGQAELYSYLNCKAHALLDKYIAESKLEKKPNKAAPRKLVGSVIGEPFDPALALRRIKDSLWSVMREDAKWEGGRNLFFLFLRDWEGVTLVEKPLSVSMQGATVAAKMDVAYEDNGKAMIVDWKTGIESDVSHQALVYRVCYERLYKKKAPVSFVYLNDSDGPVRVKTLPPDPGDFKTLGKHIWAFRKKLLGMLKKESLNMNVPDLDKIESASESWRCECCVFRSICEEGGHLPGVGEDGNERPTVA